MGMQNFVEKLEDRIYFCGREYLEYIDNVLYVYDTEDLDDDTIKENGALVTKIFYITSYHDAIPVDQFYSLLDDDGPIFMFTKFYFEEEADVRHRAFVSTFYERLGLNDEPLTVDCWVKSVLRRMRSLKLDIAVNYSDELRNVIMAELDANDFVKKNVKL